MNDTKIGKWFEGELSDLLNETKVRARLDFMRLYDTHTAGGKFLPKQHGDYIVSAGGTVILVECKATMTNASMKDAYLPDIVDRGQAAKHVTWRRSGSPACFLHYSELTAAVEIWPSQLVTEMMARGGRLPTEAAPSHTVELHELVPALVSTMHDEKRLLDLASRKRVDVPVTF